MCGLPADCLGIEGLNMQIKISRLSGSNYFTHHVNTKPGPHYEDREEVRKFHDLPDQTGQPVVDSRVGVEKVIQVSSVVEKDSSSPAQTTKPCILLCKQHWLSLPLQQEQQELIVPIPHLVTILWRHCTSLRHISNACPATELFLWSPSKSTIKV